MSNEKNLIPFDRRTEEEQREISRKGGIASGAARRRKKSLKEAADLYLSLPVTDKRVRNKLSRDLIDPEDIDNQMAVVVGITAEAQMGNPKAAAVLAQWLGEDKPKEDLTADAMARAEQLLGGIESAID